MIFVWQEIIWPIAAGWWALAQAPWVVILLATLGVCFAAYVLLLGRYIRITFTLLRDTSIPLSMVSAAVEALEGQEYDFLALDGLRLRGTLVPGKGPEAVRATIVFCHEFGVNRHSCLRYCGALVDAGFDVFAFDFRNHGDSSHEVGYAARQWLTDKEISDVLGALAFVESLYAPGRVIGLFGVSRGGAAAVVAAAQTSVVRAIVTDSLFSTDLTLEMHMGRFAEIVVRMAVFYRYLPQFWRFFRWLLLTVAEIKMKCRFPSVRKTLRRMHARPILFIHGQRDSYVGIAQAKRLYKEAAEPKSLWIVPKARHNRAMEADTEHYTERTVEFFERYLVRAAEESVLNQDAEVKPIGAA